MSFEEIREKIKDLLDLFAPIYNKFAFLRQIDQFSIDEIVLFANMTNFVENLNYYDKYFLERIEEIFNKDWEIDLDEAYTEKEWEDIIGQSLLSMFGGDREKLKNYMEENFPKMHKKVQSSDEQEKKL